MVFQYAQPLIMLFRMLLSANVKEIKSHGIDEAELFCLLHSPVLFGHEGLDLCLRSRLLATELVARKTQHSEAVELLEEFLIAFVLGGRTSFGRDVYNERDLARKGAEVADVAVDVLGGEPRVQGVARRCHDAIGPRRVRSATSVRREGGFQCAAPGLCVVRLQVLARD